jgi:hypothetical protein
MGRVGTIGVGLDEFEVSAGLDEGEADKNFT